MTFEPIVILLLAVLGLFVVYIVARLISAAHYRSKRDFLRSLEIDANKGDE